MTRDEGRATARRPGRLPTSWLCFAGYHLAFLTGAGLMALGVLASAFVADTGAASTAAAAHSEIPDPLSEAA